ncbi:MAG TPA: 5-formyltetrahydrofolate cyclo-ligase [Chitinophagaceae bacterium]|jgi:5-formyltetrahydrofolate cyclo-ligase|nr:5-formyltetrahydrofolate cyclo-ligase [Chitinophagaceae bacterium]
MIKNELRKALLSERMAIDDKKMEKLQDLILINFQHLSLPYLQYLHTYQPIEGRHEPDPDPMVSFTAFRNPGLQIVVPKLTGVNDMLHILVNDHTVWRKNQFGIPEPEEGESVDEQKIDLVFVPMLGCDKKGNRIGYGKGYYDRFLVKCREDVLKIGLSFLEPIESIDDVDPWDVPLDFCITPQRVYEF